LLRQRAVDAVVFAGIPDIKVKQFAVEAQSLNLASMNGLAVAKRYTLAAALEVLSPILAA
jgi:hypothetical protein